MMGQGEGLWTTQVPRARVVGHDYVGVAGEQVDLGSPAPTGAHLVRSITGEAPALASVGGRSIPAPGRSAFMSSSWGGNGLDLERGDMMTQAPLASGLYGEVATEEGGADCQAQPVNLSRAQRLP